MRAAIVGISGPVLLEEERALFAALPPAGVILFGRNVDNPAQVLALTGALRAVLPNSAVIAVDQEGGRVARLKPPHWRKHPSARAIGALRRGAAARAAFLTGALIGLDCAAAGFDLVCAPVLDLRVAGANDVVGDRAYGSDPEEVAALGGAMASGLLAAGVMPVGKHAPGHGRATVDSHHALPTVPARVDLAADFEAFRLAAWLPWMMTAHLLYAGLDSIWPGTLSPVVIEGVIRKRIGFGGVLVSDDLAMRALDGAPGELAATSVAAGCDLALQCAGVLADSEAVLRAVPPMNAAGVTRLRVARAMAADRWVPTLDAAALAGEREGLLAC